MISIIKRNNWLAVKIVVFLTLAVPLGTIVYESIILVKSSVVFLGEYPSAVGIIVLIYYAILLLAGMLWVLMQLKSVLKLKNETRKNELLHLQSQVNPHFFFNMLNNVYGMVDKDTDKAKKLILKLSDLMRYSIYQGEKSTVSLEEEVVSLKNYISLHKMRYHKTIDIQFQIDIIHKDIKIMPLLLIILLENAFKHGVENLRANAYVHLNLKANKERVIFEIENNFDEKEIPKKSGIGIKNLKRRLELVYPKKHELTFTTVNSVYKAQLELQL